MLNKEDNISKVRKIEKIFLSHPLFLSQILQDFIYILLCLDFLFSLWLLMQQFIRKRTYNESHYNV